jgi:hypothetical protein
MANAKPHVAVACVCEKVLIEPDNVVSVIRIVDTFYLQIPEGFSAVPSRPLGVALTAFVSVKAGDVTGQHEIGLVLRQPNGKKGDPKKWPIVMNQPEEGANLKIDFILTGNDGAPPELGLYWFDVLWGEEVLSSIPFKLMRAEPTAAPVSPNAP